MNMPKFNMSWIYIMVIAVLIGLYMTGGTQNESTRKEAAYSKFKDFVRAGYAKKIVINRSEGELQLYIKPDSVRAIFGKGIDQLGKDPYIAVGIGSVEKLEQFLDEAREAQQFTGEYSYNNKKGNEFINMLIYNLLPIVLIVGIWIFFMRRMGGGGGMGGGIFSVGKSRAKMSEKHGNLPITFKDGAGHAGAKPEMQEIVDCLKTPQ